MTPTLAVPAFTLSPAESRVPPLDILGEPVLVKLSFADTNGNVAMFHVDVPHLSGPPLHRHSREDEWFYVLDGEIILEVDGQRFTLQPGDSAFARRGTAHAYQNFSNARARMLVMVTPANFQHFFEQLSALNSGLPSPDFAGTERLMNEFGMELLGPPLS
jgi:quercetin dioxygenase-like cupin family protein